MWERYLAVIRRYSKIPLSEERRLIRLAKRGCSKSSEEIVLRHIGFVIFRLRKRLFPEYLKRFGEDFLGEAIPLLYQKVKTYNLRYYDKQGSFKPVKFVSYIWKRIEGFITDSINKETEKERLMKLQNVDDLPQDQPYDESETAGEEIDYLSSTD